MGFLVGSKIRTGEWHGLKTCSLATSARPKCHGGYVPPFLLQRGKQLDLASKKVIAGARAILCFPRFSSDELCVTFFLRRQRILQTHRDKKKFRRACSAESCFIDPNRSFTGKKTPIAPIDITPIATVSGDHF